MINRRSTCLVASIVGMGLFGGLTARADFSIAVPNYSFENPIRTGGNVSLGGTPDSNNAISNWDISGDLFGAGGVFGNTAAQFASLPAGTQFAYLAAARPGYVANLQLTPSTNSLPSIVAGIGYTLTVAVGNRMDNVYPAGTATISLLAGNTVVASNFVNVGTVAKGTFIDLSATLDALTAASYVGQQLSIRITETNTMLDPTTNPPSSIRNEAAFDNVRLTGTGNPVPEPASLSVLAIGAGALLTRRRR